MIRALIAIASAAGSVAAQSDSDIALMARVRQHIAAGLAGFPDYTCQETMDRSVQAPDGQPEFRERLRLDVIGTPSGELFAWPGSSGFTAEPIRNWIGAGAIGIGNFGTTLYNLFVAHGATVRFVATESRDQQTLYRFDFHAPLLSSRYTVTVNGKTATTAYSGSFWVNRDSLDLVRLDTRAEQIPPDLDCLEARDTVTYGRVRLGAAERLLPAAAELVIQHLDGRQSRNSITFTNCRHYGAQTSITFGEVADAATTKPVPQPRLPAGVALDVRLEQPIASGEAAAGDPIVARLDKPVRAGGVSLAKGARIFGRIRRLEQHFTAPPSILVGLQFFEAEAAGGRVEFSARLTGPQKTPDVIRNVGGGAPEFVHGQDGLEIVEDGAGTGVGSFRVWSKKLDLRRGFHTTWKTR